MKTQINEDAVIHPQDLMEYTSPRLSRRAYRSAIRGARKDMHLALAQAKRYEGGLAAEIQSGRTITAEARKRNSHAARKAWADRNGREIDLNTIMAQLDKDGAPVWTIVDPLEPVSRFNGGRERDCAKLGGDSYGLGNYHCISEFPCPTLTETFVPSGVPKLPAKARRILTDKKIRKRAAWIGVLYQPSEWTKINPDPAVVVKWKATGKYAALAVWGGDYHRIMEFVH